MSLDPGPALRAAILDQQDPALQALAASIADQLEQYRGEPAVFAFRPVPDDAPELVILVNPPAAITDADALRAVRPIVECDVVCYGRRGTPGDAGDQSPIVEAIGFQLRELFHRQKFSVQVDGYSVIQITARGPVAAPADDAGTIGRMVNLAISLRRNA
jgi:hypothetical protein